MSFVAVYVHDLRSSGVVRNAMAIAARLARDHRVTLVAGYGEGLFREEAEASGVDLVVLAARASRVPKLAAARRLRRWLREHRPHLLISAGNHGHATAFLAGRGLARPLRVYRISNEVQRPDGLRYRMRRRWLALLLEDAARLILVGRSIERFDMFAPALESGKAVALANGVDVDRARALAAAPSPHPWLGGDVPVVLGLGRLRPQKNFECLIDAVGIARATRRIRLVILGGGSEEAQAALAGSAERAGLGDDFLLAGETDNVFAWLSRATVFALPSRWEGSSMALLEALAVGTPVVASVTAGDAAHVLDHGRYGLVSDGRSAEAFAEAILAQIAGPAAAPGERARHYALDATLDAVATLVAETLASRPA